MRHTEQLIRGEIRRLVRDPLARWRVYRVTSMALGNDEHENQARCSAVMADLVRAVPRIAAADFDLEADNWMVYLAAELSSDCENHTNRGVWVETIDPYDVMDQAFVVDARCASVEKLLPLLDGKTTVVAELDLASGKTALGRGL